MKRRGHWVILLILIAVAVPGSSSADNDEMKPRLVEAGDEITIYMSDLTGSDRLIQPVQWKQKMRTRKADYIQLAARYDAGGMPGFVVLLVDEPFVKRIVYRCPDSSAETCTLRVDDEFQYGGDTDGNMRFLVFHDQSVGQWQKRFVNKNLASNFARGVQRFEDAAEAESTVAGVLKVAEFGVEYLGEFLVDVLPAVATSGGADDAPKEVRLVEAGDEISFYRGDLTGQERIVQVIEWSQNLKKVEGNYVQLAARLDVDGETDFFVLFVQEEITERLAARCTDPMAMTCTVTVDAEFQYGGDSDGTMRFLVFHNRRALGMFQHRFVNQNTAKNFAVGMNGLKEHADEMNVPMFGSELAVEGLMKLSQMGQAIFGHPLRDF